MEQLNNLEATILSIIEGHKGRENYVLRVDLVDRVNQNFPLSPVSDRKIRMTIAHLREQHGAWIGSCGRGYFTAQTDEEVLAISGYYEDRALSELYSAAKIRKSSLPALLGQLSLRFGAP